MPNKNIKLRPINHVAFLIDESGSMRRHAGVVERVFEEQIKTLADQSVTHQQETRVSLYVFHSEGSQRTPVISCIAYDCDVLRLPSLRGLYAPDGGTPLVACGLQALLDLKQTPEIHADHAFLLYALTDGEETDARDQQRSLFRQQLERLKENWTVCALVPNDRGISLCQQLGFYPGNIQVWDATSEAGLRKVADDMKKSTATYMTLRSQGFKSSKNLFKPAQTASRTEIVRRLKPVTNPHQVFKATGDGKEAIESFVSRATGVPYVTGSAFYELVKPETIQPHKRIFLRTRPDGHVYSGTLEEVRQVLGLPVGGEIKVAPAELKDFQVFVESTSVNRNVVPEQEILVMKF